jgi:hypothetical protein
MINSCPTECQLTLRKPIYIILFQKGEVMRKTTIFIVLALSLMTAGLALAQTANPLPKAGQGDWVEFTVNSENQTEPFLSVQDQHRWRVVSSVQPTMARIDNYSTMAGQRVSMGPIMVAFDKPYEPVPGLAGAKIKVVSSTPESLTVKGKSYACTKIVRQISLPVDAAKLESGWNGTSTIWICPDIPVGGIVKIENKYESQLTADSTPQKINETWVLADFGLKNWKEE